MKVGLKMGKNTFIIVTANNYPHGDAGAVRLQAFADILSTLGYSPYVICMGQTTHFKQKVLDNVCYMSLRYPSRSFVSRVKGRLLYTKNLKRVLRSFSSPDIKGILIDSGNDSTFKFIKEFARKSDIPLYYDSVEWYSASEFKNGERSHIYQNNNNLNTTIVDAEYKVIAISEYLRKHFESRGIHTVRIPMLMDVKSIPVRNNYISEDSRIKIVYAGSIGPKDHIRELVDSIGVLDETERSQIEFCVIGITKEQYVKQFGKVDERVMDKSVRFMGRVERSIVLEQLQSADFAFLLRPAQERYAMAGFPTKVVEGLASGLPMLCNDSSDLALYLQDGVNSVMIDDCSTESCVKALRKVLTYSREELNGMKIAARKTAEENFDWRLYVDIIRCFIAGKVNV